MSSHPLALSDAQLDTLFRLAQPLQPQCRDAFLKILSHELRDRDAVGDGEFFRLCRETIKANGLFDAPDLVGGKGTPLLVRMSKRG